MPGCVFGTHRPGRALAWAGLVALALAGAPGRGAAAAGTGAATSNTPGPQTINGIATAVSGDALMLGGMVVHLIGIDAPDPGQTCRSLQGHVYDCGGAATAMLAAILRGQQVQCVVLPPLAVVTQRAGDCMIHGRSIAGAMVVRGWAFADQQLTAKYALLQTHAQSLHVGMWAGRVEPPWLWRSSQLAKRQGQ